MIASLRELRVLAPACALALVALGCKGGDTEGKPAAPTGESVEVVEEDVQVPDFESPLTGTLELPADFPSDVPRYPGAELAGVDVSPDGATFVSFRTSDEPAEVARELEKAFASQGWSAKSSVEPEGSTVFADKEGRTATVFVTRDAEADSTSVDLFLYENG